MFNDENLPPGLEQEDWEDWVQHRKESGNPLTQTGKKRALMKLHRMHEAGEKLSDVIDQSIECGWRGLWPVKRKEQKPQSHRDYKPGRVVSDEKAAENVVKLHQALESAAVPKSMPKGQRFDANGKPEND